MSDLSSAAGNRALAGAVAPAAPFPRLEEDNCNRKHSRKSRYSTEMNILGYIREHGEINVAELVVTVSDCLSSKEFQKKWHSFLTGFLRKRFPSGMWIRERQPRSGNWHAHCVVNLSRDIKTRFPIVEVEAGDYPMCSHGSGICGRNCEKGRRVMDSGESHCCRLKKRDVQLQNIL